MPVIYDNIETNLIDGLSESVEISNRVDFCVGYFNLRGWKKLGEKIENLPGAEVVENNLSVHRTCRLLVGMQKAPQDILRSYFFQNQDGIDLTKALKLKLQLAQEFKEQLTVGAPTEEDEKTLQKLKKQLESGKLVVKLHLRHTLHAKLYLAYTGYKPAPMVGFLGSSNLTVSGLAKQGELNIDVLDQDAAKKLAVWFDNRWSDKFCLDISKELIEVIDESWASEKLVQPYHIYLKIAYHLSREARAGINEFRIPKIFQNELLEFQQKAVSVAAHHLNKRGGVVIGDVVGLGKTITATALAKIFEDDFNLETLIICPKNLVEMWEDYKHRYRLRAHVISQSKVQTELYKMRRYRVVIIDESHNLRNDQGKRYKAIKEYLNINDSKVILLSATPYNKTYLDLSNQLRLFLSDDQDLGISPETYIASIDGAAQFSSKHTETFIRSIKAFEKSSFSDDWRELMRLYLVRRTRSFIKNNYAETDATDGRKYLTFADGSRSYFPDRIPKRVEYGFDANDPNDQYARLYSQQVVGIIEELTLARYGLHGFINPGIALKVDESSGAILANLSRAGKRLMGFCRTNLFKRLESSGFSFLLSLSRHILRNYLFVYAIQNDLPIPIGKNFSHNLDGFLEDSDPDDELDEENQLQLILSGETYLEKAAELYSLYDSEQFRNRFEWIDSAYFTEFTIEGKDKNGKSVTVEVSLLKSLVKDAEKIIQILALGKSWTAENDKQLNALHDMLTKVYPTQKVLVFTQFADTAYYLSENLRKRGIAQLGCVTGASESPTDMAHRFSPVSNKKTDYQGSEQELRILITTDVLSEGQNLQDAHIIVNYDLPWAIIRLIQRAGRVDRIGQKSNKIYCYSFLPEDGIEAIINLRARLIQRIQENANVVGSDETFFDGDPINITDLYNEKSGILEEDENEAEVDLASYAYQIWKNATDANPELLRIIPNMRNVVYATKSISALEASALRSNQLKQKNAGAKEGNHGVIVYTKTAEDSDVLTWLDAAGEVITNSQFTILQAAKCSPDTKPLERIKQHHELVGKGLDLIRADERSAEGVLGKTTGVKYRVYTMLDAYCKKDENSLFVNEPLKKALDDIYKFPLKEFARETLNRQLKAGIRIGQLADLVVSLREDDKLCIVNEDRDSIQREPQIVCSMGLKADEWHEIE